MKKKPRSPRTAAANKHLDEERRKRAALLPPNAHCEVCGESDPVVLVASDVRQILCADHHAIANGQEPLEGHHFAGRANDSRTILVSSNMHRRLTARGRNHSPPTHPLSALVRGAADLNYEVACEVAAELDRIYSEETSEGR